MLAFSSQEGDYGSLRATLKRQVWQRFPAPSGVFRELPEHSVEPFVQGIEFGKHDD